jgi:DNA-binding NarL/FixJ family response regulator
MAGTRAYLSGNRAANIPLLTAALATCGYLDPVITTRINVTEIGRAAPDFLVLDIDAIDADPLELLRQTRFVVPSCIIAIYSAMRSRNWARSCHLAGANCILSKNVDETNLVAGIHHTISSGCYTDPIFIENVSFIKRTLFESGNF